MKILVVEDTSRHQKAAKSQLKGHKVTIVSNWPEARKLLRDGGFEAVLSDLMLPSTNEMLSEEAMLQNPEGILMPLGFIIALHACLVQGVRYVAVLTDSNHHSDPISAGLDYTGEIYWYGEKVNKAPFNINGVKAIFSFAPMKGRVGKKVKNWAKALKVLLNS